MATNKIGGNISNSKYYRVFLIGLALGTLIRVVAFIAPIGVVSKLEKKLLPHDSDTDRESAAE